MNYFLVTFIFSIVFVTITLAESDSTRSPLVDDDINVSHNDNPSNDKYKNRIKLFRKTENGLKFICSGSVVKRFYILTAASCVQDNYGYIRDPGEIIVRTGLSDIPSSKTDYEVIQIIPHYNYVGKKDGYKNDIAIIELNKPIIYRNQDSVCLSLGTKKKKLKVFGMLNQTYFNEKTDCGKKQVCIEKILPESQYKNLRTSGNDQLCFPGGEPLYDENESLTGLSSYVNKIPLDTDTDMGCNILPVFTRISSHINFLFNHMGRDFCRRSD